MYEVFEKLSKVCNEVREDLKKRIVENPDCVEHVENVWMWEIIQWVPDDERIKDLDDRLSRFDRETKYNQNERLTGSGN